MGVTYPTTRRMPIGFQGIPRFWNNVFTDQTRSVKLGDITADRIIDWSARYNFADSWGVAIGAVGRKGWRSLWRAHYQSYNPGDAEPDYVISEENPMAKFP